MYVRILNRGTLRNCNISISAISCSVARNVSSSKPLSLKKDQPHKGSSNEFLSSATSKSFTTDLDFNEVENAFKSKTSFELVRGALVYQLCTIKLLVDNGMKLSHFFEKVMGKKLFNRLMKLSFYGHFVAGEDDEEVKQVTSKLQQFGVGAILDYAVEEELSEEEAKDLEMKSCSSISDPNPDFDNKKRYNPQRDFGDRRKNVVSARTYFYKGEEKCEQNTKIFLKCIDSAGATTDGGFAAIKLTALGRPQFLLQFSEVLMKGRELFKQYANRSEGSLHEKKFDLRRFEDKSSRMGILMNRDDSKKYFTWMDKDENKFVDLLDWNELISEHRKFADIFVVPDPVTGEQVRLVPTFDDEEEAQMKRMLRRIDSLAKHAMKRNVRLMIDAEQTYFQPAISRMALEMMRKFNKERTVIMNTYQCYLKGASEELMLDLALSQREDFHFGCKLVRGAYMDHERERAEQMSYEDPIQPNYEATCKNYNENLKTLVEAMRDTNKASVMVASHNEDSVKYALGLLEENNIAVESSELYFGQLLGMCDHITFPLGQAGHKVFKYVPYGPVQEVLPYLHRRAQENRSILGGRAEAERKMMWSELGRRIKHRMTNASTA